MHIRSKDTVVVITGKDKGKEGKVLVASPKTGKVVVEGVAIATKHARLPEVQEGRSRGLQSARERQQGSCLQEQEVRRDHRRVMQEETSNGSASLR